MVPNLSCFSRSSYRDRSGSLSPTRNLKGRLAGSGVCLTILGNYHSLKSINPYGRTSTELAVSAAFPPFHALVATSSSCAHRHPRAPHTRPPFLTQSARPPHLTALAAP